MTNVKLLQEEIRKSPKTPTEIAAEWGMSMPTYYSRTSGNSEFKASEIIAATTTLNLTRTRRDEIFFVR